MKSYCVLPEISLKVHPKVNRVRNWRRCCRRLAQGLFESEIIGENNISDGVEITGNNVISKYGYYGKAAAWDVGDVHMKGGAGPMNTIYSWGTLKEAGIIFDMDTVVVK